MTDGDIVLRPTNKLQERALYTFFSLNIISVTISCNVSGRNLLMILCCNCGCSVIVGHVKITHFTDCFVKFVEVDEIKFNFVIPSMSNKHLDDLKVFEW